MTRVFYSPTYVGSRYAFDTTRKAGWIAASLETSPIAGIELCEPLPLTERELARVHSPNYIDAVRSGEPQRLAESQGFEWDAQVWPMVLSSNGGVVAAARAALAEGVAGSLSSGLHHARFDHGSGYCTFNGLVIAAKEALSSGARSVLILDLDAHCGGGTASLIRTDSQIWQLDVSVSAFDTYASTDRIQLEIVQQPSRYLETIKRRLTEFDAQRMEFDLCIYNAGMDPHEDCTTGGLRGITDAVLAEREKVVFNWCRSRHLPVAFVLAGGYASLRLDEAKLVALHRLTLAEATRAQTL